MSRFRQYAPSVLPGRKVSIRLVSDRLALVGRTVHYDVRGSVYARSGVVQNAVRREIQIDDSWIDVRTIEQMTVEDPS